MNFVILFIVFFQFNNCSLVLFIFICLFFILKDLLIFGRTEIKQDIKISRTLGGLWIRSIVYGMHPFLYWAEIWPLPLAMERTLLSIQVAALAAQDTVGWKYSAFSEGGWCPRHPGLRPKHHLFYKQHLKFSWFWGPDVGIKVLAGLVPSWRLSEESVVGFTLSSLGTPQSLGICWFVAALPPNLWPHCHMASECPIWSFLKHVTWASLLGVSLFLFVSREFVIISRSSFTMAAIKSVRLFQHLDYLCWCLLESCVSSDFPDLWCDQ